MVRVMMSIISIVLLIFLGSTAKADELIFHDDFQRDDVGENWTTGAGCDENTIKIINGRIQATNNCNFIEIVEEFSGNLRIEFDVEKEGYSNHDCWDFYVHLSGLESNSNGGAIRFDYDGFDGISYVNNNFDCGDDVTIDGTGINKGKAIFTYRNGFLEFIFKNDDGDILASGNQDAGNLGTSKIRISLAGYPDAPRYVDNVKVYSLPTLIGIDVKPGSYPNCFNLNGKGVIPVAILGSADFDVENIDTGTLRFNGLEVQVRGKKEKTLCHIEDVSGDFSSIEGAPDGNLDLVCQFEDNPIQWISGDGQAELTGELYNGLRIKGTDTICIVP